MEHQNSASDDKKEEELRVLMMGYFGVGKSSIVIRFINDQFEEHYYPTVEDRYRKDFISNGKKYVQNVLDTAGIDDYQSTQDEYINDCGLFIITYSVTHRDSFEKLTSFINRVQVRKQLNNNNQGRLPIVIVGNKIDKNPEDRKVTYEEGKDFADEHNLEFIETSALTGTNIEKIFEKLVDQYEKMNAVKQKKPVDVEIKKEEDCCQKCVIY